MSFQAVSRREPASRGRFVANWVAGGHGRSLRRRLMAVLRNAHRALGIGRGRLGLGALGPGATSGVSLFAGAAILALPLGAPAPAHADTYPSEDSSCVSAGGGTAVGRIFTGNTTGQPEDGSGTYSTITGCSADGNNSSAATAYGSFSNADGAGTTAIGFNSSAESDWASAFGLESRATANGATALGFGSQAASRNAVAIGGAASGAGGTLSEANSTIADGIGAIAIGSNDARGAQATDSNAIAIGGSATAALNRGIAIGAFSTAGGAFATAVGDEAQASGEAAAAFGSAAEAAGVSSFAGGHDAEALADRSTALGNNASAGAEDSIALGTNAAANAANDIAIGTDAGATGNAGGSAVSIGAGNVAAGAGAVALGDPSTATGDGAIAQGLDSTATGDGTVALGNTAMAGGGGQDVGMPGTAAQGAVAIGYQTEAVGQGSVALGNESTAQAAGSLAFGDGADTTQVGGVALGSDSVADTAAGVAGYVPSGANGGAIGATTSTLGAVSVGDAANGEYRQITGVAAGTEDSDAVNVSQLQGVEELANTGFDLSAQGANQTNVAPGDSVDLSNTDGNIEVAKGAADNDVTFDLADDITLNSATLGDTVLDTTGLSFATGGPSITAGGIDAGDTVIANVAPGTAGTDAVNVNQLDALGDTPLTFSGNAGADVDRLLGETFAITGGAVTAGTYSGDNLRTETDGAGGIAIQMTDQPDFGGVIINEGGTGVISGVSDGVDADDAVNVSQLEAVETTANAGWDLSADGANQTNVAPGDSVDLSNTDGNIEVAKGAADNDVTFDLADDITLNSATLGDTVLDTTGLSFATGGPSITAGGIDAGNTVIANVADGVDPNDAVNVSQLEAVETTANAGWNVQTNGDSATNVAPGDTVEFLDGQNIEITRTGTDITIATVADLAADSLTLASGQVFDSAGLDMNNTTITNLAPGTAGTDAVNLNQLQDAQTRYYSVNDGGTPGGNFNNDGATGLNALAAGVDAAAGGDAGVAVGEASQADIEGSVALGSGSISDRAIAPATGTLPAGSATITYNTADHTLLGAVSVGDGTAGNQTYRQITNVADGTDAQDAVTIRQLQGAMQSVTTTGSMYFHANSTAGDSVAAGNDSIAVGPTTVVNGDNGIGMGFGAIVDSTAPGGMAIGQDSHVMMADGVALGTESQANGEQSVALGAGAQSDHAGSVALGSNSATDEAVGTDSTTINGTTYDFAGDTPVGTVSVGDTDSERTITNVAAGRISADSTDAINGSQLYATNTAIENLADDIGDIGDVAENSVQYDTNPDGSKANSITLQGGDPNAPVVISNVGEGVADTDAVNVAQLDQSVEESRSYTDDRVDYAIDTSNDYTDRVADRTLNDANSYTDQKFNQLNQNIGEIRSEARQAAAIGLAAASLRFDDRPGKLSVAVGGGYWKSESALAFGAGYTSENGRVRANLTGTTAGGDWGVGAGVSFTLN